MSTTSAAVEELRIDSSDLHLRKRVMGRMPRLRRAVAGTWSGICFGLLVGIVCWNVSPWTVTAIVCGVVLGALSAVTFGAIAYGPAAGTSA